MDFVVFNRAYLSFGSDEILRDISLTITDRTRLALVGRNGTGKTTFLRLISGELEPTKGDVFRKSGIRVGFLRQEQRLEGNNYLVEAVLREHAEWWKLYMELSGLVSLSPSEYDAKMMRFLSLGGYALRTKCEEILEKLGFGSRQFSQPVDTISGGERNRAAIASLLLMEPDLMLLDEPTNHIDYDGLIWLAEFLRNTKKPFIIVSHDRHFLDLAVDSTAEIADKKVKIYSGGYSQYAVQKAEYERQLEKEAKEQKELISRTEEFIRRNIAGQNTKQAQARRKMLEKLSQIETPSREKDVRLRMDIGSRGGNKVLEIDQLDYQYGSEKIISSFSAIVGRGEHIGIVGKNGCGKTTLLRLIVGKIPPQRGSVNFGAGIVYEYFAQDFDDLPNDETPYELISKAMPNYDEEQIRSHLGAFSISGDEAFRRISSFSGGERARIYMAKLVLSNANLLILDEPTNHLDIPTRLSLENALAKFSGTILVVSHDRYFLDKIAHKIWAFENKQIVEYAGNFSYYLQKRAEKISTIATAQQKTKECDEEPKKETAQSKNKLTRLDNELRRLEREMKDYEAERTKLINLMSEPSISKDFGRLQNLLRQLSEVDRKIEKCWEEIGKIL